MSDQILVELATLIVPDWNRNWSLKIWSIFEARWHSCCQHILSWRESNILTSLLPKYSHTTSTTRLKPSFQFLVPKNWSELSIIPFTGIVSILLIVWKHEWVENIMIVSLSILFDPNAIVDKSRLLFRGRKTINV